MTAGGVEIGWLGELHPQVAEAMDFRDRTYVAELDLETLFALPPEERVYTPLPRYPAVERDLALLVPRSVSAERVVELIRREGGPYLREVALFDVYEGKQVAQGYRSLAYAMVYRADDPHIDRRRGGRSAKAHRRGARPRAGRDGALLRASQEIPPGREMIFLEGSRWRQSDQDRTPLG